VCASLTGRSRERELGINPPPLGSKKKENFSGLSPPDPPPHPGSLSKHYSSPKLSSGFAGGFSSPEW